MDFLTLEVFQQIGSGKTFRSVADEYSLSPSTVSKMMHHLEEEIGTSLFSREHRTVSLTKAGLYFYSSAGTLLAEYRGIMNHMRSFSSANHLSGIITCSDIAFPIDDICQKFMMQHPDCFITIEKENDYGTALEEVRARHCDFVIAHVPAEIEDLSLGKMALQKDPAIVLVSPEHRLSSRRSLTLEDLCYETLITNNYSNHFTRLLFHLQEIELINIQNLHNYGRSKIIEYVEHNYGVAILFESDIKGRSMRDLKAIPLVQAASLPLSIVYLSNSSSTTLTRFKRFLQTLRY